MVLCALDETTSDDEENCTFITARAKSALTTIAEMRMKLSLVKRLYGRLPPASSALSSTPASPLRPSPRLPLVASSAPRP